MNAVVGAAAASAATAVFWHVAAGAAGRRTLSVGSFPALLPAIVAGAAVVAAHSGAHASELAALSGSAVAAWIDARTGYIFDPLTFALMSVSFGLAAIDGATLQAAYGAAIVGAALLLLHAITRGRGIGLGDVKLGATLGFALGATSGLTAIGLAFVLGAAYAVWLLTTKRASAGTPVRFAPFIAAGTFAAVLTPQWLLP